MNVYKIDLEGQIQYMKRKKVSSQFDAARRRHRFETRSLRTLKKQFDGRRGKESYEDKNKKQITANLSLRTTQDSQVQSLSMGYTGSNTIKFVLSYSLLCTGQNLQPFSSKGDSPAKI